MSGRQEMPLQSARIVASGGQSGHNQTGFYQGHEYDLAQPEMVVSFKEWLQGRSKYQY